MLEMNKEQFLSFNISNRIEILKMIAQGSIKYIGDGNKCQEKKKY